MTTNYPEIPRTEATHQPSPFVQQLLARAAIAGSEIEIACFDGPRKDFIGGDYTTYDLRLDLLDYERGLANLEPPRKVVDRVPVTRTLNSHVPFNIGGLLIYSEQVG